MKTNLKRITKRSLALILGILMLFSTLMVGSITASAATFTNETTIYFDASSVDGWASDNAKIGAIFYYQDNVNWCIETNSDAYSDSNIGKKTAFSSSSVYKTCTKVADNIYSVTVSSSSAGSVRFLRINKSNGTELWNYSARMSVDSMGSNNCVKISGWDNNSTWSTYNSGGSSGGDTTDYYLTGWLNKGSVTSTSDANRKFVQDSNDTDLYTLTYKFTNDQDSYQYPTIFDGTNAYHPATHGSASGTAGTKVDTNPGNDPKWKVSAKTGDTVNFTWVASTKTLSWTIGEPTTYKVETGVKVSTDGTTYTVDSTKTAPSGGGDVSASTGTTLEASTIDGYTFAGWEVTAGDTISSTNMSVSYTPTANTTVYAKYKKNYTVSIGTHTNGTIKIDGAESNKTVAAGTSVTIKAEPDSGYAFSAWTGDLSSEESATVIKTVKSNITANATFEKLSNVEFSLSANVSAGSATLTAKAGGENIENNTKLRNGTQVVITAVPAAGYEARSLEPWNVNGSTGTPGTDANGNPTYTFEVTADTTVEFYTQKIGYNVTCTSTPNSGGSSVVKKDGSETNTLFIDDEFTVDTTINDGYAVGSVVVKAGDQTISPNGNGVYKMTADKLGTVTVTTNFVAKKPTVTFETASAEIFAGDTYKINATADCGTLSYSSTSLTVNSTGEFTAPNSGGPYTVTVKATNSQTGVDPVDSDSVTFTVTLKYTDTQTAYNALKATIEAQSSLNESDYDTTNEIWTAYQTALSTAQSYAADSFPAPTLVDTKYATANTALVEAYEALDSIRKSTTIYVVSKYGTDRYVKLHMWNKNDSEFTVIDCDGSTSNPYKMIHVGEVKYTNSSDNRHLYKLTYTGKANFIVFAAANANGNVSDDNNGTKLTGDVTGPDDFGSYFIDLNNVNIGSSSNITSALPAYSKLNITTTDLTEQEPGTTVNLSNQVTASGSLAESTNSVVNYTYKVNGAEVSDYTNYTVGNTAVTVEVTASFVDGLESVTKTFTISPKTTYSEITVSSLKLANNEVVGVNPKATVVMGAFDAHPGDSTKYKPVVKVKDSLGNVNTFYGAVVNASAITTGQPYTFAPITITGLSKGSYKVTAEIIGYNDSDTQVAYGASAEKAMDYGCYYKETAYTGDVAWVDAVPSYKGGDKATLIKWSKYKSGSNNEDERLDKVDNKIRYTFYLPHSVDMSNVTIYHNFSSLTINGQAITSGNTYNSFTVNTDYQAKINGTDDCLVKFMKGSQNSTQLYLNTKDSTTGAAYDLPMELHNVGDGDNADNVAQEYKESVTCVGTEVAVDQTGAVTTGTLKKFKGRGNSSWKASCNLFGKYAYNMTLNKSANLFGLAGDNTNGNTKYSLLANNVDEAQVRNAYIYKLAKELGYEYFPNFQMADVYDNGVYMGSYLICQKVELGKKGMITEPEIKYDDPVNTAGETVDFTLQTGIKDGCEYQYSSNRKDSTNYNSGGTYLMEFELPDRYGAEASWFKSKKGQPIVVASPENASKAEMEFIIPKWNAVEDAVYSGNIDSVRNKIDIESFAKMYLIQELSKNLDACSTSYNILYKSAEDKFYAEPVWDYDWTLGQYNKDPKSIVGNHEDVDKNHSKYYGFFARYKGMSGISTTVHDFEAQLCQNPSFWADVQTIWKNEFYSVATAQNTYLTNTYIPGIKDTILMNENRWGFIANNLSGSWGTTDTGSDFNTVTNATTTWITNRLEWLNGKITSTMYTVSAGKGATMTYMDNMGNGKLNAYTQFAEGTRLTFTAARQPGLEFKGWSTSTDGTTIDKDLSTTDLTITVPVSKNATYTPVFAMTYTVEKTPVTYYVDMHGDSNLVPTINFADGDTLPLTKVGSSTVYSGTYNTKYYVDNNKKFVDIATKISTISTGDKTLSVSTANALNKKCLETGEVWIEATKSIAGAETSDTTTAAKGATITDSTTKRIYWGNKGANTDSQLFNQPAIYYWTVNSDGSIKKNDYVTYQNAPKMTNISDNNYYYDVPKEVNRVIFKDGSGQTVDITVTDTAYAFSAADGHTKNGDKFNYITWTSQPADPTPISYASSYELYVDDTTGTHSIAPTLSAGATVTEYTVDNEEFATVDSDGKITPKAIGTTKVTITIKGTSNDTVTVEITIKVIPRPVTPAYAIMSYQSNTSSFQAVGGDLGTLDITLTGSAYNNVTTGGIINGNTVKYAIADPTVTAYADLAVTVKVNPTTESNYKFVEWTKNNTTISGAKQNLTVKLNSAGNDSYIVTFSLNSVQVVFTYNFVDYDTSNGVYQYVENGPTKQASYKTAPKSVLATAIKPAEGGYGYVATEELIKAAETNMPNIISNYFRYSLGTVEDPTMIDGIYYVTANMTNTARTYKVSVNGKPVDGSFYFQNEVSLNAAKYVDSPSETGYVWKIGAKGTPISDKQVYTFRVAGDTELKVAASDGTDTIKNLSVINATFHEIKTQDNKNYVGQNFYIQNFYRENDPVYDANGAVVAGATDKTFEGAGVLSYKVNTSTNNPVSATVRNFLSGKAGEELKTALLGVAEKIGVEATGNSASNSIHTESGLNYSFVKGSKATDDITGQTFMQYSQTQGCYSYFYQALTEQSKLYRSQSYVVYSYYVYSYMLGGNKTYVYVMSDQCATAKVYPTESN